MGSMLQTQPDDVFGNASQFQRESMDFHLDHTAEAMHSWKASRASLLSNAKTCSWMEMSIL